MGRAIKIQGVLSSFGMLLFAAMGPIHCLQHLIHEAAVTLPDRAGVLFTRSNLLT